eukprot:408957-Hanusia_phi.AAC.1
MAFLQPAACFFAAVGGRLGYRRIPKTMFALLFHATGVWEFITIFVFPMTRAGKAQRLVWALGDFLFGMVIEFGE